MSPQIIGEGGRVTRLEPPSFSFGSIDARECIPPYFFFCLKTRTNHLPSLLGSHHLSKNFVRLCLHIKMLCLKFGHALLLLGQTNF